MKISKIQFQSLVLILPLLIGLIAGCDSENLLSLDGEMLEIVTLRPETQTLNIGNTTTLTATVSYSGDTIALAYRWHVSGGKIVGDGSSVVYIAPETAGTYTITFEVTDGAVTASQDIRIEVSVGNAIVAMSNRYWQGNAFTQTLTYRLDVRKLFREKITLRYEILQDAARVGAFLSVAINNTSLIRNRAIGAVQPAEPLLIADEIDVSSVLRAPGQYELTFTLEVVNIMEDAWLLRKLYLIGAEGTLSELR